MSGPKYSEYDLEQERRQRLREALEIRKAAYCRAVNERQKLLKQIEAGRKFLESKKKFFEEKRDKSEQDECRPEKSEAEKLKSAYRELVEKIETVLSRCEENMDSPVPKTDNRTESESTECEEADWINVYTEQLKTEFDRLLETYNETEKRTEEKVREIRECVEERREYGKAKRELAAQREKSNRAIQEFAEKLQETINSQGPVSEMKNAVAEISAVRASLLADAGKLLRRPLPKQAEQVRTLTAKTMRAAEALINTAERNIRRPLEQMKRFAAFQKEVTGILRDFEAQQKRAALRPALTKINDVKYDEYEEPDHYKTLEEKARRDLNSVLDRIEDAICDDSVCAEDVRRLEAIYQSIQETVKHSRGSLAGELSQAWDILGQVKIRAESFERCYCGYTTACEMLNRLYAENGEPNKQIDILDRLDYDSIGALYDEEARINGILVQENERKFIRNTIKEVMEQFGYNMAEELVLHREQKGYHLLCKKEGGDTGIHVHYSNGAKKRIMLEVVGVGKTTEDKLAEGVNGRMIGPDELTESRRQQLLARQTGFCLIHPRIVAALEEKGIRTNAIEFCPPGMEFCEEIALVDKEKGEEKRKRERRRRQTPKFMEKRMSKRKL